MDRIETIQLRPYRRLDRERAIDAFGQLVLSNPDEGLRDIFLLQDMTLQTDLCIVFRWRRSAAFSGKSALGIQLAEVFSEFGQIDHTVWSNTGNIFYSNGKAGSQKNTRDHSP